MIEIKNLYKRYHGPHGSDWVLRDINLTIPHGVSVGLVGRNGAGKSTLLRLIGGMDMPDRGEVIRHGRVSWPIGLAGGFKGAMTGRQNVKFVARVHGIQKRMSELLREVEAFAEIGKAFDEPVNTYSSGMRSRLAFGLSLAFDFDIYLSDEATAVGDRAFKEKARQAFQERVNSASLIMVSHGEGTLRQMCQAGIFLDNGQAQWFDDIDDAISAYHDAYDTGSDDFDDDDETEEEGSGQEANTLESRFRSTRRQIKDTRKSIIVIEYQIEQAYVSGLSAEDIESLQQKRNEARLHIKQLKKRARKLKEELESS